jgi:hypothetical protein
MVTLLPRPYSFLEFYLLKLVMCPSRRTHLALISCYYGYFRLRAASQKEHYCFSGRQSRNLAFMVHFYAAFNNLTAARPGYTGHRKSLDRFLGIWFVSSPVTGNARDCRMGQ